MMGLGSEKPRSVRAAIEYPEQGSSLSGTASKGEIAVENGLLDFGSRQSSNLRSKRTDVGMVEARP